MDDKAQIIVATGVTQSAADVHELIPTLDRVEAITDKKVQRVLADAGYKSEANFTALEARNVSARISLGRREDTREKAKCTGPATRRMGQRLESPEGRKLFKTRKHIVEPAFGWAKSVLGFRAFSMRGLALATAEWDLVCAALNLRRMNPQMRPA